MKMRKRLALVVALVFALSIFAGCGAKTETPTPGTPSKEDIKIGIINSLSGSVSSYGTSAHNGALLAIEEVNKKGGLLDGRQVKYVEEDDQGKIDDASNASQKLINQDNVVAIIGATISSCSNAAAPSAQAAGVPMITPTSTATNVTENGEYISRICFLDPYQSKALAKFAVDNLKANKAAILYNKQDDYSTGLAVSFKEEFTKLGGTIVEEQTYGKDEQDFNGQLTKIKGTNPEILFLPDYYNTVGLIAKQAKQQGLKATLLGADGWDSPQLFEIGGDAVEGAIFSAHYSAADPSPETKAFVEAYKAKYQKDPDSFAALGYDAAMALMSSINTAGSTDKAKIKDAINDLKDFKGASGTITLDDKRNPIKTVVFVKCQQGKQEFVAKVTP
ncbi:MAG: ABC transporter substrate-binding protein [Syntrophomonadaceae bacterium]|nr:ABC transporter substrate-binding protein [Syntrophomonadaceae bacterium]